ncbi:MAG TPA: hypothetical protein ENJ19_08460 [Gammaproteobacteria bacterium]|nr:hypothetical protein [Gammaproteobacteria bacterium]
MQPVKWVLVLVCCLALPGCSGVALVYNNADWYFSYKIKKYAPFNTRQKAQIDRAVDDYFAWHRAHALPDYIQFLKSAAVLAGHEPSLKEVAALREQARVLYAKTVAPLAAPAAAVLVTLSEGQLAHFERNLRRENDKRRRELTGTKREEYLEERAGQLIDVIEHLVGDLSNTQKAEIRRLSRAQPVTDEMWLARREASQQRLLALLRRKAGLREIEHFLRAWLTQSRPDSTADQRAAIAQMNQSGDQMVVAVFALMTEKQKRHYRKKLSAYIEDLADLLPHPAVAVQTR